MLSSSRADEAPEDGSDGAASPPASLPPFCSAASASAASSTQDGCEHVTRATSASHALSSISTFGASDERQYQRTKRLGGPAAPVQCQRRCAAKPRSIFGRPRQASQDSGASLSLASSKAEPTKMPTGSAMATLMSATMSESLGTASSGKAVHT